MLDVGCGIGGSAFYIANVSRTELQASIFSLQYHNLIIYTVRENKGNDHQRWSMLMFQ